MRPAVAIGKSRGFALHKAILVYSAVNDSDTFATVHDLKKVDGAGPPQLGPGQLLTMAFLQELAQGLGSSLKPEVLPDNVVCRTPHVLAWWTPACVRPLFFRKGSELGALSGKHFPLPALVWKVNGYQLSIRALKLNTRPGRATALFRFPVWNMRADGLVCQGSMSKPAAVSASTLAEWERGYFAAEFTHVTDEYANRNATLHKGGIIGLWKSLAGGRDLKRPFPIDTLSDPKETLQDFVEGKADA